MKKKDEGKNFEIEKPKKEPDLLKPKEKDEVHKGYNEKNPAQPQGSFTPDSKSGK